MSPFEFSPIADLDNSEIPRTRTVVAVVIECRGRIALFRRSPSLSHDGNLWHCITGFVELGVSPLLQALEELREETGLAENDLLALRRGPSLVVNDNSGAPWLIHTYTAEVAQRRLVINWEHDSYRWTAPGKIKRFINRVAWLDRVLRATGHL